MPDETTLAVGQEWRTSFLKYRFISMEQNNLYGWHDQRTTKMRWSSLKNFRAWIRRTGAVLEGTK